MVRLRTRGLLLALLLVAPRAHAGTLLGDVQADGRISAADAVLAAGSVNGSIALTVAQAARADVDEDGLVQQDDVLAIRRMIVLLDPYRPVVTTFRSSPQHGEGAVAVTRETVFRFDYPLSEADVTSSALRAEFAGQAIPATLRVSPDRTVVTLFYPDGLPGAARVRLVVQGGNLLDRAGRPVDADDDGAAGGTALIDFDTLGFTRGGTDTVAWGRVFASELVPGAMGGSVSTPLQGATITVDGDPQITTVTDAAGSFRLEGAPIGTFYVHVDGTTATNGVAPGAFYPSVGKPWTTVAGAETNVGDVFLPLVQPGTLQPVSTTSDVTVRFAPSVLEDHPDMGGVSVTVPAGSLRFEDGTPGLQAGIAPVPPDRVPGKLPPELRFAVVITFQTDGATNLDVPAPACFPNLPDPVSGKLLAPGDPTALWSFNHDAGRWEVQGGMTVTPDGTLACTDHGVGITAPGWHGDSPAEQNDGGRIRKGDGDGSGTMARATGMSECSADDEDGACACKKGCAVMLQSGEERLDRVDLAIPGRGDIAFTMRRRYRSQLDYDGPLGFGWDFDYNERLFPQEDGDVVRVNGRSHVDTWTSSGSAWTAPAGHFRDLSRGPDGSFALRSPDGFVRRYLPDGRVSSHEDRFGNAMLFGYDARGNLDVVIDPYGREIDFVFETFADGIDRLVTVRDFIGREVTYAYDDRGDLVAARTPVVIGTSTGNDFPDGRTERYTYSSGFGHPDLNHNLMSVTFPEEEATGGPPGLTWVYGTIEADPLTFDKVRAETEGGTNASGVVAGGTRTFEYEMLNPGAPPGSLDVPRGMATITERNGTVEQYFVNELGHHILTRQLTQGLRPGEPPWYETASAFDDDGLLVRRTFPEGNQTQWAYEAGARRQQRNVVEVREVAGPRAGGEDLVTTFTYEPLFNRLASTTDPRGNATGYVPPLGTASAARYTTRILYDYQEGTAAVPQAAAFGIDLSSVQRGLGDANGDGRTDQAFGLAVRTEAPAVTLAAGSHEALRRGSTLQPIVSQVQWNDRGQLVAAIDPEGNVTELLYNPENDPDGDGSVTAVAGMVLTDAPTGYLHAVVQDARASDRRTSTVPPLALRTSFTYDDVGNVVATTSPRGVVTGFELNALNEPIVVRRGADVALAQSSGELLTGESALQYATRLTYDHDGRVVRTEVENRDDTTPGVGAFVETTRVFDILGNVLESSVEVDATTRLTTTIRYDPSDLPVDVITPEGNVTRTEYDERNLVHRLTRGHGTPDAATIRMDYDLNGNRSRLVDAEDNDGDGEGEAVRYQYDGFDRVVSVLDALDGRLESTYDVAGNIVGRRAFGHPAGQPATAPILQADVRLHHDELSRTFRADESLFLPGGQAPARPPQLLDHDADGFVTTRWERDALSRTTFVVEDDLETTETVFDGASRVVAVVDALGNRVERDHDANGNPVAVRSVEVASGGLVPDETFTTTYVYDQLDRLVRATDNAGQTTRFGYDSRDNLISRSDPEGAPAADPLGVFPGAINAPGNTAGWIYDGLDRQVRQDLDLRQGGVGAGALDLTNPHNADGRSTLGYAYDADSRLIGITDDNGNRTSFAYDPLDRRIARVNADMERHDYDFDADGNLVESTDPDGTVVTRAYDALGRLVRVEVDRAPAIVGTTEGTYEYDGLSRLTRTTDDNGGPGSVQVVEHVHDSLSRPVEERQDGAAVSRVFAGDGRRVSVTYPGGRVLTQAFDAVDRVREISDSGGILATSDWIGPGLRELRRVNGNGTRLTFLDASESQDVGYDAVRRIERMKVLGPGGAALVDREHAYNRANQRLFERRHDDAGLTDHYGYDSMYRIVSTELDANGLPGAVARDLERLDYVLDGVHGRRSVQETTTSGGATVEAYVVDEMNEYTQVGATPRVHSDNGNLTDDGTRLFRYDYRNRLVQVVRKSDAAPVAEYLYDAGNRRMQTTAYSPTVPGAVEKVTRFRYDGWRTIEEQGAGGATEASFVYSPVYVDEIVQVQRTAAHPLGAAELYLHQDARADVVAVTDAAGSVVERRFYDDFGNAYDEAREPVTSSAVGVAPGFQGQRLDAETGLLYFRNRYYDPQTGSFLQRDPVWDPMNLGNQRVFSGANPASRVDPDGMKSERMHATDVRKALYASNKFLIQNIDAAISQLYDRLRKTKCESEKEKLREAIAGLSAGFAARRRYVENWDRRALGYGSLEMLEAESDPTLLELLIAAKQGLVDGERISESERRAMVDRFFDYLGSKMPDAVPTGLAVRVAKGPGGLWDGSTLALEGLSSAMVDGDHRQLKRGCAAVAKAGTAQALFGDALTDEARDRLGAVKDYLLGLDPTTDALTDMIQNSDDTLEHLVFVNEQMKTQPMGEDDD